MKRNLLFALLLFPALMQAQLTAKPAGTAGAVGFYQFLPSGYNPTGSYNYPLIINLHGLSEKGDGSTAMLPKVLGSGLAFHLTQGATMRFNVRGQQHAFMVLLPQMSTEYLEWEPFYIDSMINYAIRNLKVDVNRIFITGWSLGGGGAWKYTSYSLENARRIAGIFPVAAAPTYTNLCNIAAGQVAVWAHHAIDDSGILVRYTEDAINGINACNPVIKALANIYPEGRHGGPLEWSLDTLNNVQYPNMFQWMIGTSRANTLSNNLAPIASAGNDTIVIVPSTKALLNGLASYDPNDVIVKYSWSRIAGPSGITFEKAGSPITNVSVPDTGKYTFLLTVTDQFGNTQTDAVNVTFALPPNGANALPIADAGPDQSFTSNNFTIVGNDRDFDGVISSRQWKVISSPVTPVLTNANTNAVTAQGMSVAGVYTFEYAVTDNMGGVTKDTVKLTRLSVLPVEFTYFHGKKTGKICRVLWGTANEVNAKYFEILRSTDGSQFHSIGKIVAGKKDYAYVDNSAPAGSIYYRVKQVDKDENFSLSAVITVNNSNSTWSVVRYPNPASNTLFVGIEGDLYGSFEMSVSDLQGKVIIRRSYNKEQPSWKESLNISHLQKGMYTVQITIAGFKETVTFIKQ